MTAISPYIAQGLLTAQIHERKLTIKLLVASLEQPVPSRSSLNNKNSCTLI